MPNFTSLTSDYTVVDYLGRMSRKELTINRDYQRTDQVWPDAARSFLIESMLLGYPIPKLSIREMTDLVTQATAHEIVDGQQRSKAIEAFYANKFAISKKSELQEARGCYYKDLDPDLQRKFTGFRLTADIFVGASNEEIIELFRRINSYTMSLNPEEHRHASFQGDMKWFIYRLSKDLQRFLESFGVLGVKQLARMQDCKLVAEITHALLNGIQTTTAGMLNAMYKDKNSNFPEADWVKELVNDAVGEIREMPYIVGTKLTKPYNFYCLMLAVIHAKNPVPVLEDLGQGGTGLADGGVIEERLSTIAEVLNQDEPPEGWKSFWQAAEAKTNTRENREIRAATMLSAVAA
jgi:hypothetical protein